MLEVFIPGTEEVDLLALKESVLPPEGEVGNTEPCPTPFGAPLRPLLDWISVGCMLTTNWTNERHSQMQKKQERT